jgi:signal transduction histidine kinase
MRLESATVCLLRQDDHEGGVWLRQADGILQRSDSPDCLAALAAAAMATAGEFRGAMLLQKISTPAERERAGSFLDRIGAAILLPVVFRDEPVGLLALGTKRSGQPFDSDDLTLLRTLAHQTAIALQNARSYAALEDLTRHLDAKVQRQTEELRTSNEELSSAYESLKNAQSQLIQSEKMASLGQLVAGVAHELNNPASFVHGGLANLQEHLDQFVSVIETYEQIARRTPAGAEEVEIVRRETDLGFFLRETPQLLRICSEGSERIKAIVEDLRVFVRAEKGERTPTRVVDGIDSTLRLLSNRLDGITLRKDYEDAPAIQAHPAHLNQVWMNLLSNAIDAVEGVRQPEVHVSLRYANGHGSETPLVEVQIRDNGCGVGTDDLRRVFDPFFTTKPVGRGTGLGLSIVFGIVKSHGGSIRVESEPGNGTTMTVHLPVRS